VTRTIVGGDLGALVRGLLAALIGAALAALLAVIVSRFTSHQRVLAAQAPEQTESRKEIPDQIITLAGGVFAFILGLVIVTSPQVMTTARQTTIDEVNGLSHIYQHATSGHHAGSGTGRDHRRYAARKTRGLEAEEGLPTFIWGLLTGDGFVMLCVPLLKGITFTKTNTVPYMMSGVMIALSLWFVYELNYPFSGGLTVKPDAYTLFLQQAGPPSQ